jgi:hypothetical protein
MNGGGVRNLVGIRRLSLPYLKGTFERLQAWTVEPMPGENSYLGLMNRFNARRLQHISLRGQCTRIAPK